MRFGRGKGNDRLEKFQNWPDRLEIWPEISAVNEI